MSTARYIIGDTLTVLRTMPDASVDLVLSSPPFLGLRSYLPAGHPDKTSEVGSESTPGEFIDTLLDIVEECRRVLAPHGSLCFELGDTYAGSGGHGGDYEVGGLREGQPKFDGSAKAARSNPRQREGTPRWDRPSGVRTTTDAAPRQTRKRPHDGHDRDSDEAAGIIPQRTYSRCEVDGWPLDKSLTLIPELFRLALAYGVNPLTGRPTPRWRVRNVVRWVRPNPPVGALGDKFRPATTEMVVACVARDRYFDLDSCRAVASGTTDGTPFSHSTIGSELSGALHTDKGSHIARWWCDFSQAKVAVDRPVAGDAQGLEIRQLISVSIRLETPEGHKVMDLEPRGDTAPLAGVPISVERSLSRFLPVRPPVVDPPAPVCGAVLASPVGAAPLAVALESAEVVGVEGALVTPDRLSARLTLKINGALSYAYFVVPITRASHTDIVLQPDSLTTRKVGQASASKGITGGDNGNPDKERLTHSPPGAPPLDWWKIPTHGYPGAHYATWPEALCVTPIKAMCPPRVCTTCGQPSRRIVDAVRSVAYKPTASNAARIEGGTFGQEGHTDYATLGWTDCGCPGDHWRTGVVLDPFAGSGTTLAVVTGHGRDAIGIDLDERNAVLAEQRIGGLWLTVEDHRKPASGAS